MRNTCKRTAGVVLLAALMTIGLDAQPRFRGAQGSGQGYGPGQGRGFGPCGQAYGPGQGRGFGPCGQAYGPGRGLSQDDSLVYGRGFDLDLTVEQQEQMKALRLEHYNEMKPLRNEMAELKARERTLMSEEEVDMKGVNSVIDDQTGLLNKMKKVQADHRVSMREILTGEQLMQLEQRRDFRGYRRGGWNHCPYRKGPGNA